MSSTSLRDTMRGVEHRADPKPRRIAPSTAEYWRPDGARVIRLHRTDILTFVDQPYRKTVTINVSGYYTKTTRNRINDYLPGFIVGGRCKTEGYRLHDGGPWYICRRDDNYLLNSILLTDGLTIINGKLPDAPKPLRAAAIKAGIARFAQVCEKINFEPPLRTVPSIDIVKELLEKPSPVQLSNFTTNQLLDRGYSWDRHYSPTYGYDPVVVSCVLARALTKIQHKLVAAKLGSDRMGPELRKAIRAYLTAAIDDYFAAGRGR